MNSKIGKVLKDEWKLLTFQNFRFDNSIYKYYLTFGLLTTWLCGIGRYWDNPRAEMWQYLGLGSIAYIFLLSALLWLLIYPLKPRNWSYANVLLFVSLTALPALLYAIPVERFMDLTGAQNANVLFLAIIALWRVALLIKFLSRSAGLSGLKIMVATLLPLTLIVTALTALNLEHVVFKIMAGLLDEEKSQNDAAYMILMIISYFSVIISPILLIIYAWQAYKSK